MPVEFNATVQYDDDVQETADNDDSEMEEEDEELKKRREHKEKLFERIKFESQDQIRKEATAEAILEVIDYREVPSE